MSNTADLSGENIAPATLTGGVLNMRYLWIVLFCLTGCYKNHLYVQQEWLDANFLASSRIKTPDPRQENPPCGQRLLIAWCFPQDLFDQELTLYVTVRLWNQTEQQIDLPVKSKHSHTALDFPAATQENRILTYRIVVLTKEGETLETWNHPLWTELIQIP